MANFSKVLLGVVVGALSLFRTTATAQSPANGETKRTDLQQQDLSVPGWEAIQVRVDFGLNAFAPFHKHPGEEVIYVLEGTLLYEVEGRSPITLTSGGVLIIPAATPHSAKNVGNIVASELATYIVEKGKPLLEQMPASYRYSPTSSSLKTKP